MTVFAGVVLAVQLALIAGIWLVTRRYINRPLPMLSALLDPLDNDGPVCDPECRDPQSVCSCDPLDIDGDGFTRNEAGMVTGGPWPKKAGEDTVDLAVAACGPSCRSQHTDDHSRCPHKFDGDVQ